MKRTYEKRESGKKQGVAPRVALKRRLLPRGSLYKHPKTGGYYLKIRWPDDAKPTRQALIPIGKKNATKNKAVALVLAKKMISDRLDCPTTVKPMQYWIDEFYDWNKQTAGERQSTYNKSIATKFTDTQDITYPAEITAEHLQHYFTSLQKDNASLRTVQAHRNSLRKFCRFLQIRQEIEYNPADLTPVKPPVKRPPRYLTDKQARKFFRHVRTHAPQWLQDAIAVVFYTGMRLSSLQAIQWLHVGPAGLTVPLTKTGNYTIIPFDNQIVGLRLKKIFDRMKRGKDTDYIFPHYHSTHYCLLMRGLTKKLPVFGELEGKRAGNQWHLLRATWAVNCARRGATVWQLMNWGGWTNPQTVMRYVNIAHAAGLKSS